MFWFLINCIFAVFMLNWLYGFATRRDLRADFAEIIVAAKDRVVRKLRRKRRR